MNEDRTQELTKELSDSEKLAFLVEEALANRAWQQEVSARLAKVESFVEDRSRDTRPMLELIHKEVADLGQSVNHLKQSVRDIRGDIRIFREDAWREKHERQDLADRIEALEQRPH